jgi:hypothetical protein
MCHLYLGIKTIQVVCVERVFWIMDRETVYVDFIWKEEVVTYLELQSLHPNGDTKYNQEKSVSKGGNRLEILTGSRILLMHQPTLWKYIID